MRMTVARIENSYTYVNQDGVEMRFEECSIGKFKGKTFAIHDGFVNEVEIVDYTDVRLMFGNSVRIVREIDVIGETLPFKDVFLSFARHTRFYIDEAYEESDTFSGYTFNRYWNGWQMPMFTKEVAEEVCNKYCDGEYSTWKFDKERDAFVISKADDEENEVYEGFDIQTENGNIHVYDIGSGNWIWDEYVADDDEW